MQIVGWKQRPELECTVRGPLASQNRFCITNCITGKTISYFDKCQGKNNVRMFFFIAFLDIFRKALWIYIKTKIRLNP